MKSVIGILVCLISIQSFGSGNPCSEGTVPAEAWEIVNMSKLRNYSEALDQAYSYINGSPKFSYIKKSYQVIPMSICSQKVGADDISPRKIEINFAVAEEGNPRVKPVGYLTGYLNYKDGGWSSKNVHFVSFEESGNQ